jgi:hypothetical protein
MVSVSAGMSAVFGETLQFEGAGTNRFVKVDFNAASKVATLMGHAVREPQ